MYAAYNNGTNNIVTITFMVMQIIASTQNDRKPRNIIVACDSFYYHTFCMQYLVQHGCNIGGNIICQQAEAFAFHILVNS